MLISAVTALAAALSTFRIADKGLWFDETFSVAMAKTDLPTMMWGLFHQDAFFGLYYVMLRPWVLFGDSPLWLRLPSVLFTVATVPTILALSHRLVSTAAGWIATVLLAADAFFVQYAQEARGYSLAMFAVVLATYVFVRAMESQSTALWLGYGLAGTVAIYAHASAVLVIAGHLAAALYRPSLLVYKRAALGFGVMAGLTAPLLILISLTDPGSRFFAPTTSWRSFVGLMLELTGGSDTRMGKLALLALSTCCLVGIAVILVRFRRRPEQRWQDVVVVSWFGLPLLALLILGTKQPLLVGRYLLVALPGLFLLAGAGVAAIPTGRWRAIVALVLVALCAQGLPQWYQQEIKEGADWEAATNYVLRNRQPDDGVIFLSHFGRYPFEYYLDQRLGPADAGSLVPVYPDPGWGSYQPVVDDEALQTDAEVDISSHPRVWAILVWGGFQSVHDDGERFQAALERDFSLLVREEFGRQLEVRQYERTNAVAERPAGGGAVALP